MASQDVDDPDDLDDEANTSFLSFQRPSKRRKLNSSDYGTDAEIDSTGEVDSFPSSGTVAQDSYEAENKENEDDENAKPRLKHKIHIPKNSELPSDAFFTQPPHRSSSPYRIDQFHWHKPTKPSSPSISSHREHSKQQTPRKSYVNAISGGRNVENRILIHPQHPEEPDDEFGLDDSYENLLADLPHDAFSSAHGSTDHPRETILVSSQQEYPSSTIPYQKLTAPLTNLRQTTLFGNQAPEVNTQTQSTRNHDAFSSGSDSIDDPHPE